VLSSVTMHFPKLYFILLTNVCAGAITLFEESDEDLEGIKYAFAHTEAFFFLEFPKIILFLVIIAIVFLLIMACSHFVCGFSDRIDEMVG
jgi:hypothetical protein